MVRERWPRVLIVEISCRAVRKLVSSFIDGELDPEFQARLEAHLHKCHHCKALVDGTMNIVHLVADERTFELPSGFGERLRQSIEKIRREAAKIHSHNEPWLIAKS